MGVEMRVVFAIKMSEQKIRAQIIRQIIRQPITQTIATQTNKQMVVQMIAIQKIRLVELAFLIKAGKK